MRRTMRKVVRRQTRKRMMSGRFRSHESQEGRVERSWLEVDLDPMVGRWEQVPTRMAGEGKALREQSEQESGLEERKRRMRSRGRGAKAEGEREEREQEERSRERREERATREEG